MIKIAIGLVKLARTILDVVLLFDYIFKGVIFNDVAIFI
jgi:hypothetical protein